MTIKEITNDLLKTYEGNEGVSIDLNSWFCTVLDTKEFYQVPFNIAKECHSLAYSIYLND